VSAPRLRFTGALEALPDDERRRLADRRLGEDPRVGERTAAILERVRRDGDRALRELARELDGVALETLEVPRRRRRAALERTEAPLRAALERAARNITRFHAAQLPRAFEIETEPGVTVGLRPDPLSRVGLYAPGGRASYPSTVLMTALPARVAGVGETVLCSPPDPSGDPPDPVLAAAEIAGVDRVFAIGGAGAIAALAFGTETVPRVDRIVGPGNAYVAEAKRRLQGVVSIDSPAGPSELLVIADPTADPEAVAGEVMAQAEHDPEACALVVAVGTDLAAAIARAIERALPAQPRGETIAAALAARGGVLSVDALEPALEFAAEYAPEHLLLAIAEPAAALPRVRNAGSVFLGLSASVAFGDYMTGANHTLPTGGSARSYSGLSALDYLRWTTTQRVTPEAARRLAGDVALLAASERLPAHQAAAAAWSER
jgi:histidinol dehydrogenase